VSAGDLTTAYDVEPEPEAPEDVVGDLPGLPLTTPRARALVSSWRRVDLDVPTAINVAIDRLMRERPYGEGSGRVALNGQRGFHGLQLDPAPATHEVATGTLPYVEGEAPPKTTPRPANKPWDTIRHGTESAYQRDCRKHPDGPCDACKAAHANYARERRSEEGEHLKTKRIYVGPRGPRQPIPLKYQPLTNRECHELVKGWTRGSLDGADVIRYVPKNVHH
jgi:hypothetical protein